jgi:hypothetical protein
MWALSVGTRSCQNVPVTQVSAIIIEISAAAALCLCLKKANCGIRADREEWSLMARNPIGVLASSLVIVTQS